MNPEGKIRIEDHYRPSDKALEEIAEVYTDFYKFQNARSGTFRQLQDLSLEDYWKQSRELFWTSTLTKSEDLEAMGLDFSLPFTRKEVMDFVGRIVSMNIAPHLSGDDLNMYSVKVLQAMYKKWRLKSNDRVEKFWQILYGVMNGTVCTYIGFDGSERRLNYITAVDNETGAVSMEERLVRLWNDAFSEIVPLEEIYLAKKWQRNIQKQGKLIRKQEMTRAEFDAEFPKAKYPNAEFVVEGLRIAEDSLFYNLLGGSGVLSNEKIQVLKLYDTDGDKFKVVSNGIWLNPVNKSEPRPNPFAHKQMPFVWVINEPIDEKFAYGMSLPHKIKDPHKILNTSFTMLVERELRAIDPPIISSDFEAPQIIFGQNRVIPVNDVDAYKEFQIQEASGSYLTMMNSLQGTMTSLAQGGFSQIAPSRQPKSAREIVALENLKQQSLGNALLMYHDMLHQEIFLLLKTMLQFYPAGKYANQKQNLVRAFTLPNSSLMQGGTGALEVRFVQQPGDELSLFFEAQHKSIMNGMQTEIIEMPVDIINNLEFYIDDIKLEPEKSTELERAAYFEQVLQPMISTFIPMGIADPAKTYLRFLERMGEHPADYTSEQNLPQIMGGQGQPAVPGQLPVGAQTGNMNQSTRGTMFGGQSAQPFAEEMTA